jgi:ribonuclease VapC
VDKKLALMIAELLPETRSMGLSLGDHACPAMVLRINLPALTADKVWSSVNAGVLVQLIR